MLNFYVGTKAELGARDLHRKSRHPGLEEMIDVKGFYRWVESLKTTVQKAGTAVL